MKHPRPMQAGDWFNAVVNLIIGVLLGIAASGLLELATSALWPLAVLIPLLFGLLFLGELALDGLIDRFFPSGIRPANSPGKKPPPPLTRRLSLPFGALIGVALERLGLAALLLDLLP